MRLFYVLCIISTVRLAFSQDNISSVLVSQNLLRQHVFALAADSMQGRKTGTKGQLLASKYCTKTLRGSHTLPIFKNDSLWYFYQTYYFNATLPTGLLMLNLRPYTQYVLTEKPETEFDKRNTFQGQNVGSILIGTDLKKDIVVISAHYDHLGETKGAIFHGADDNASGSATVLAIAALYDSLLQKGIRSRRSICFLLFSGEEGGLIGSKYFLENSPFLPQNIVCDLNVDMVGRRDRFHRKKQDYCYVIGPHFFPQLRRYVEEGNQRSGNLVLDYRYDDENHPDRYFYRSDHYNFAKNNIPALFFMDGEHPDYHQTTDTADKIEYELLQKRATLVFQTAWALANPKE